MRSLLGVLHRLSSASGQFAVSLERQTKRWIAMLVDACICAISCYVSVVLRIGFFPDRDMPFGLLVAVSIALALPIFWALGVYREIISQSGLHAIVRIARACAIYTLPFASIFTIVSVFGIPRTTTLIQPILLFLCVAGSRLTARYWLIEAHEPRHLPQRRVMIYGAGSAGRQLAGALAQSTELSVLGFFDDDPTLVGSISDGLRIHSPTAMADVAQHLLVSEILLALPSASLARRNQIVAKALASNLKIRTLPRLADIAHGRVEVNQLREVDIEDLLGRPSVEPNRALMRPAIEGQTIMVTGAGGSIGAELCRQLILYEPAVVLLFELNEYALFEIHRELEATIRSRQADIRIIPLIGSVCAAPRLDEIIQTWCPHSIYHAAAYKHVPLVEHNPAEGIRTNVLGTQTLAKAAIRGNVANVVFVSTDKAVRPTSVMGATKRAAELELQALDPISPGTCFSMVRFGNVLGSSGSVVPLFREQLRRGGPITLTDKRITRYFMTVSEAAELVLQAGALAHGGEVFVLDMGQPVAIADLARKMIELAGLTVRSQDNPDGDIEIQEVGLRPGEKLYEELLLGLDPVPTAHPRIFKSNEPRLAIQEIEIRLNDLQAALESGDRDQLLRSLSTLVPEYHCTHGIMDWIHLEAGATVRPVVASIA